jgi:uncharacterized membrane-anchored protein YitT (DUF2179 family)
MKDRSKKIIKKIKKYLMLFIGAVIAAVGLEIFLIPNQVIDGGVVGISIMLGYITTLPIGLFIFVLNVPFLIFGYKQIGKSFAISTFFSITILSIMVSILHPIPGLTKDLLLATVFGGLILGIGVGLIIRYGGSLDGTEIVAIILDKRSGFSVGEIVLFFNVFILSSAGLVFGWDRAMYSLLAYFIAYKMIDVTIAGLDEAKAALIISDKSEEIAKVLLARLGRGVTLLEGKGAYTGESKTILYSIISRLEISKLKTIISEIDDKAFVVITDVHEAMGGIIPKKSIH